jgi:hypothetical protein
MLRATRSHIVKRLVRIALPAFSSLLLGWLPGLPLGQFSVNPNTRPASDEQQQLLLNV